MLPGNFSFSPPPPEAPDFNPKAFAYRLSGRQQGSVLTHTLGGSQAGGVIHCFGWLVAAAAAAAALSRYGGEAGRRVCCQGGGESFPLRCCTSEWRGNKRTLCLQNLCHLSEVRRTSRGL